MLLIDNKKWSLIQSEFNQLRNVHFAIYVIQNITEKYVLPKEFKNYYDLVLQNIILSRGVPSH